MFEQHSFFISCALGSEKLLLSELEEFWYSLKNPDLTSANQPFEILGTELGGILIQCPFHLGLQINLKSKIANRVLWRLGQFTTQRQQRLNEKIKKILTSYHLENLYFNYHVVSDRSKLFHEGRIAESLEHICSPQGVKENNSEKMNLYLRIQDDLCVLSLDTSGEHLHRRQFTRKKTAAPLRETLAATMLKTLFEGLSRQHLENSVLIDPCCGSGTLLFEALTLYTDGIRQYDFQKIPFCPQFLKPDFRQKNRDHHQLLKFWEFVGYDYDQHAHQTALDNLDSIQSQFPIADFRFNFHVQDSLKLEKLAPQDHSVFLISNLPYGHRIKSEKPVKEMVKAYHELFPASRSCWMSGEELETPVGYTKKFQRKMKNQGILVHLTVFQAADRLGSV
ncbi:MAG: hypothetical protein ACK5P5_14815 [Pseudobdellovibrionaceae bacterium]